MKKFLTLLLTLISSLTFACHTTNLTLVSGPTNIGGGQYQTVVQACFGQYTAGNWGGTNNFNFTLVGAPDVLVLTQKKPHQPWGFSFRADRFCLISGSTTLFF